MTVLEVIQRSTEFLAKRNVDSPRLHAELLLAHVLRLPRMRLYLDFDRALTPEQLDTVRGVVKRRGQREPLQHIVGSTSFCGLELEVSPDVLIPRPETELLAERGWKFLAGLGGMGQTTIKALDIGTGSGCLAIALAVNCPQARVTALDLSAGALAVARRNATRHQVEGRIDFVQGDGFEALRVGERYSLIISNPPYIPTGEIAGLQPEVRDFDPLPALDGGADGLDFYRLFAGEASRFMTPAARFMAEIGDGQADVVREIFSREKWIVEAIEQDYTGRSRILVARREECLNAPGA